MKTPAPDPVSLLAHRRESSTPALLLITGLPGAGKTRWCSRLVEAAHRDGWRVAGLLSPPVYAGGQKTGIALVDLAGKERRCLAHSAAPDGPGTAGLGWHFADEVLAWGNAALARISACDLLVVDELGPLEFRHDRGFVDAFAKLNARHYQLAVAVVRPALMASAIQRWPWATGVYTVERESRL